MTNTILKIPFMNTLLPVTFSLEQLLHLKNELLYKSLYSPTNKKQVHKHICTGAFLTDKEECRCRFII